MQIADPQDLVVNIKVFQEWNRKFQDKSEKDRRARDNIYIPTITGLMTDPSKLGMLRKPHLSAALQNILEEEKRVKAEDEAKLNADEEEAKTRAGKQSDLEHGGVGGLDS